jgi:beta-lactam-binding protein with PASTA domain
MPVTTRFITQTSDSIAKGSVISQDPAPGEPVDPNSGVIIVYISSGPAFAKNISVKVKQYTFVARVAT